MCVGVYQCGHADMCWGVSVWACWCVQGCVSVGVLMHSVDWCFASVSTYYCPIPWQVGCIMKALYYYCYSWLTLYLAAPGIMLMLFKTNGITLMLFKATNNYLNTRTMKKQKQFICLIAVFLQIAVRYTYIYIYICIILTSLEQPPFSSAPAP